MLSKTQQNKIALYHSSAVCYPSIVLLSIWWRGLAKRINVDVDGDVSVGVVNDNEDDDDDDDVLMMVRMMLVWRGTEHACLSRLLWCVSVPVMALNDYHYHAQRCVRKGWVTRKRKKVWLKESEKTKWVRCELKKAVLCEMSWKHCQWVSGKKGEEVWEENA